MNRKTTTETIRDLQATRDEIIGDAGRYWQQCDFTREQLRKIDAEIALLERSSDAEQITSMANDFNRIALDQIAQSAHVRAALLERHGDGKPWNRTQAQNDAIDTFKQLAAYCERVIAMQA